MHLRGVLNKFRAHQCWYFVSSSAGFVTVSSKSVICIRLHVRLVMLHCLSAWFRASILAYGLHCAYYESSSADIGVHSWVHDFWSCDILHPVHFTADNWLPSHVNV